MQFRRLPKYSYDQYVHRNHDDYGKKRVYCCIQYWKYDLEEMIVTGIADATLHAFHARVLLRVRRPPEVRDEFGATHEGNGDACYHKHM